MLSICLLRLRLFIFYSNHARNPVSHKSSAPSDVVSPRGAEWSKRGSEERCLLMRALKLMCPFGSSEGDLKKSETLSERPSHCPTADQSQSSTQISSTLFRLWSTLECSLCFNSCSVRAGWENATQSDSVRFVEYWVNVLCITTECQIVRQPWWKEESY